jgi:hypothetical protein
MNSSDGISICEIAPELTGHGLSVDGAKKKKGAIANCDDGKSCARMARRLLEQGFFLHQAPTVEQLFLPTSPN